MTIKNLTQAEEILQLISGATLRVIERVRTFGREADCICCRNLSISLIIPAPVTISQWTTIRCGVIISIYSVEYRDLVRRGINTILAYADRGDAISYFQILIH